MLKLSAALCLATLAPAGLVAATPVLRESEIVCKSSDEPAYLTIEYNKQALAPIRQRIWNAPWGLAGAMDLDTQRTLFAFQECDSTFMNARAKSGEVSVRYGLVREIGSTTREPTGRCVSTKLKDAGFFALNACTTAENSSLPFEYFALKTDPNAAGRLEFMGEPAFADGSYPPHRYDISIKNQFVVSDIVSDSHKSKLSLDYNI